MAFTARLRTASEAGLKLTERLAWIAPLATRVVIGLAFFHTGLGKWRHFERTVQYFGSLGIPFPTFNAGLVASMELVGGTLLIAGLLTRVMAAGLSSTMVVALLTADTHAFLSSWSSASDLSPTDVASFTFLLFLLWLVLKGPGVVSLDTLLAKTLGIRKRSS
jgi:putative oxidoreductase